MSKFRTFLLVPDKLICMLSHADRGKEFYSSSRLLSDQDALGRIQTERADAAEMGKLFVAAQSPSGRVPHVLCQFSAPGDAVFLSKKSLCAFSSLASPVRF